MKKVFTLFLLLAALLANVPQSKAQILVEGFDSNAYIHGKPTGWTDSIFNWVTPTSGNPYGWPTWYENYSYSCSYTYPSGGVVTPCGTYTTLYGYYPFGTCTTPHSGGPYGTTICNYAFNYYCPTPHTTLAGSCYYSGMLTYPLYYTSLGQSYYSTSGSTGTYNPLRNVAAEMATKKMNFASYFPSTGVGSFRLSYYIWNYYSGSGIYSQGTVNVYINNVPSSTGGVLIDSFQWANNTLSSSSGSWILRQTFLPASFNTSNSVYVIFRAHGNDYYPIAATAGSNYYNYYDVFLDDMRVDYIAPCGKPTAQATNPAYASSASIVAGSFSNASPLPTGGYITLRSIGPLLGVPQDGNIYTVGNTIVNGTVVSVGTSTTFSDPGLTPGTAYTYTTFSISTGTTCSITYDTTAPLVTTITTGSVNIYTWNKTVSGDWTVASNWTPTRTVPDPTDILVFDNGISDTVTNAAASLNPSSSSQGIGTLNVANTTQVHLRSNSGGTLTLNVNGVTGANGLNIGAGSGLILDGTSASLTLTSGANTIFNVNGNLEVANTSATNYINFGNAVTTVAATTGQLAAGGNNTTYPFQNVSPTALIINGTFNNKYTTTGGWVAYPATWGPSSTLLISGYTTSTTGPNSASLAQTFANFVYNASNQTSVCNWAGAPLNVTGTFNVTSTGTGTWALAGNQSYQYNLSSFVQAGGTIDLGNGVGSTPAPVQVLNIIGTFNQLGGNIKSGGSGTTQPILYFNGTTGTQSVSLSNAPSGPIVYRVSNPGGINLIGINSLGSTPILPINSGGGVRISTTTANPINTSLLLQYATLNSTLTYDTTGNIVATNSVWPTTTPPYNVVVNVNTGNTLKVPFNASIPGTLQFLSGDLDMSSYNLSIGTSTLSTNLGTILEPISGSSFLNVPGNGNVRLTTGSLTRWFGTAGLPIAATAPALSTGLSSQGFFPIAFGASNRNVYIYFSGPSALGSGGTITVTHNPATGTSVLSPSVIDPPSYVMNLRTNASWTFTTSSLLSLNTGYTMAMRANAGNLINPLNLPQLRMTHLTSDPGVTIGGGGGAPNFTSGRTGLQVSDLTTGAWYFAANNTDLQANGVYTQITTGNWTTASVWDIGSVPSISNLAVINPGVVSTISATTCAAKSLTVLGTVNDNTSGNILNVDSELINYGTINVNAGNLVVNTNGTASLVSQYQNVGIYNYGNFNIGGGSLTMGPNGGGNKPFLSYGGFSMTSGTAKINGSFGSLPGSYFTQTNGSITVDGNAGGLLANSVPHGRALFSLSTPAINLWGGSINITDPGADTTNVNSTSGFQAAFEYVVPVGTPAYNDSSAHTITLGDGVSTDPGGSPHGFFLNPVGPGISGLFNFSNLIINGAAGVNRAATTYFTGIGVQNQMTINAGGEYRTSGRDLVLNGNLTVNANGKLTTDDQGILTFGHMIFTTYPTPVAATTPLSAQPQTLSGTGIFVNGTTPAANFGNIKVISAPYVVFNTGTSLTFPSADALTFVPVNGVPSRIIMQNGNLGETGASGSSNNASATNGWVVGAYQKYATIGNIVSANFIFPIGDSTRYTPVKLSATNTNVLSAGTIAVSTKPAVSSVLSFSTLNPLKVLNRTYTISTSPTFSLSPTGTSANFTWVPSDISATANYQNFVAGINTSGTTWVYPTVAAAGATSITVDSILAGTYQVAEACPPTVISQQPANPGGCIGGIPITMTVVATGASLQYQWYHSNTVIGTVAIPNANSATYVKSLPTYADSGTYYVVITGACAAPVTSTKVVFTPGGPPPIITQPVSQGVCAGYPLTLTVGAISGTTYRWQQNGIDVSGALTVNNHPYYTISSLNVLTAGTYRVIVGNGCANDTSLSAVITLLPLPSATISTSTPLAFCQGGYVNMTANYTPGYSYQWQVDGVNINSATSQVYPAISSGQYTVSVTDVNSCTSTSSVDSVTVFPAPAIPLVTSASSNTFCAGGHVELLSNQDPTLTYQWQYNSANVVGATLDSFRATATGNYSVSATNIQGCTSTSPAIQINSLAVPTGAITASGSTNICSGGSGVTLSAPAGTGYSYQWYNNNNAIVGSAGNQISYNANATGSYTVTVSNGYCSETTAPIGVTMFPTPSTTVTTVGQTTFCQGDHVVLSAVAGPGLTYQWQRDGNNTVTTASDTVTASGSYTCTISNSGNCAETTTPVVVTVKPLPMPTVNPGTGGLLTTSGSFTLYQWYKNGVPVPSGSTTNTSGTSNSYLTTGSGQYSVFVTDGNGCTNMSPVFNYVASGVSTVTAEHIRIYPNPARDIVYIDAPVSVNISLNSIDGKELFTKANAKSIDISGLANGVYMIRVSDADGNLLSVDKLVKADN